MRAWRRLAPPSPRCTLRSGDPRRLAALVGLPFCAERTAFVASNTDDLIAALTAPGPLLEQPAVQALLNEHTSTGESSVWNCLAEAGRDLHDTIERAKASRLRREHGASAWLPDLQDLAADLERKYLTPEQRPRPQLTLIQGGNDA